MSIKLKVIIGTVIILALGMAAQLFQLNSNYRAELQLLSRQSLDAARASFQQLEQSDIRMLRAVGESLKGRADIVAAYQARDLKKLYELATPVYAELKSKYGITHWNFIDAPPASVVFARMSKPELVGDGVKRTTYLDAVKTGTLGVGLEVGKTGFVLRTVTPIIVAGETVGYQEIGEDIDRFFELIKGQTGSDVALVMDKKVMSEGDWASTTKAKNMRNNWADDPDTLVVASTLSGSDALGEVRVDTSLKKEGEVLGVAGMANRQVQRSVFPVDDASGKIVGAVYLMQDVTQTTAALRANRVRMLTVVIVQAVALCALLTFLLYSLVFVRLNGMIDKVTRVVGGDTSVVTNETDEVGRFESQVIGILRSVMSSMQ